MKALHSSLLTGVLLSAAALLSATAGCELIAGVDRDQIGGGGDAGAGGSTSSSSSSGGGMGGMAGMGGGGGMGGQGGGPECVMDADCTPPANECSTVACVDGACVTTNIDANTPTATQTAGDCKVSVCDGSGNITAANDDADTASDNKECTQDSCSGGTPSYTPVASGTACNENGGKVCNAMGTCVECNDGADCVSGVCQSNACQAAECGDTIQNGTETDVDCGGSCGGCADGKKCMIGTDCTSKVCTAGTLTCAAPACDDQQKNGDETDVDCGGSCVNDCMDGQDCMVHGDCASGFCNPTTTKCAAPTCKDGFENGDETDVDCGGSCADDCLNGQGCSGNGDCASGFCNTTTNVCAAPACDDGFENGDETDVDCGGSCADDCMVGQSCLVDGDCASLYCNAAKVCDTPTCSDMIINGTESDVDCGGTCPPCTDGQGCSVNADCESGVCNVSMKCDPPACTDGIQNGGETGVDCGGPCLGCNGGACTDNNQCSSGMCYESACIASVNGCDIDTAQDLTANMAVTVAFGGANGNNYVPQCIKVKVGTVVTINGNYGTHPLEGGIVSGGMKVPAAGGPFIPVTDMGTTKDFTMSATGTFPYYCQPHALGGMTAAVFVVP